MTIVYCSTCEQLVNERSTEQCPKNLGNPRYHTAYTSIFCDVCGEHMGFCLEESKYIGIIASLCSKCSILLPTRPIKA